MADPRYKHGVYVGSGNVRQHAAQQRLMTSISLPRNGWQVVADADRHTVDADLLRGADTEDATIFRLEAAGNIAWAYVSRQSKEIIVVMTNSSQAYFYGLNAHFTAITADVRAKLTAGQQPAYA